MDYTASAVVEEVRARMEDGMDKADAIRAFCEDVGRRRLSKMWEAFGYRWVREMVVEEVRHGGGPRPTLPNNWGTDRKATARMNMNPLDALISLPDGRLVRMGDLRREDIEKRWRFHERLEETNRQKKKAWRSISTKVKQGESLEDAFDRLSSSEVEFLYREARMEEPEAEATEVA